MRLARWAKMTLSVAAASMRTKRIACGKSIGISTGLRQLMSFTRLNASVIRRVVKTTTMITQFTASITSSFIPNLEM